MVWIHLWLRYQHFPCHHKFTGTHINQFWFIRLCKVNSGTFNQSNHNVCWRKNHLFISSYIFLYIYICVHLHLHLASNFISLLLLSTYSHPVLSSLRRVSAYVLLGFSPPLSPSFLLFYYLFQSTRLFITDLIPLTCRADCSKTSSAPQCAKGRERGNKGRKKKIGKWVINSSYEAASQPEWQEGVFQWNMAAHLARYTFEAMWIWDYPMKNYREDKQRTSLHFTR